LGDELRKGNRETGFTSAITLLGFQTDNILWHVPFCYEYQTVFFDVFSNRTDGYYTLQVYRQTVAVGQTQNYPYTIYEPERLYGFTPYDEGNYTVSLLRNSVKKVTRSFNVTKIAVAYALWTFPQPTTSTENYYVGCYANNDSQYLNYKVCGYDSIQWVNNPSYGLVELIVNWDGGFWSGSVTPFDPDYNIWRLWGSNDNVTWFPLTAPYYHKFTNTILFDSLSTTLVNSRGYTNTEFSIYGYNSHAFTSGRIYFNNVNIMTIDQGSFNVHYSHGTAGTFSIELRVLSNQTWIVVKSIIVTLTNFDDSTGPEEIPPERISTNIIIGIVIVIVAGIGIAFALQSPFAFAFGSIPTAYILSQFALGDLRLLPPEVGTGLIMVLILVAVVIWFLD
jgi:hypothetical protein